MSVFDWTPYALGGAAARPDSFTGLNPAFALGVQGLLEAARQDGINLRITSAYRSPEVQAALWEDAINKYGSPEAARKWVAPPGKSMHNSGLAVDFAGPDGGLLRDANSPEAQWLAANAGRFGLHIPMSWEPWQVEMSGSRAKSFGGDVPKMDVQTQVPLTFGAEPEEKQGILAALGGFIEEEGNPFAEYMQQPAAPQILPRQATAYRPERRDTTAVYRALFDKLRA